LPKKIGENKMSTITEIMKRHNKKQKTEIKNPGKIETILRNITAVKKHGKTLEYKRDGKWKDVLILDDALLMLHKCRIKNEPLETWVLMINGEINDSGNWTFYNSKASAENYYDRYCQSGDNCRIVKLSEVTDEL